MPRRHRSLHAAGAVVLAGVLAVSCADGDDTAPGGKTKITIGLFGDFGYRDLFAAYEKQHPDIDIVERVTSFEDHHASLTAHLATGSGASDVEAIETGFIARFKARPQHFVNFLDHGLADRRGQWLPWKWDQSLSADGKTQIGLGTDVGGLAMCYRTDLFKAAGLPTDRNAVGKLWPDWDAFFEAGERYTESAPSGTSWFDGSGNVFNALIGQAREGFYNASDEVVVASNPVVKQAWDEVTAAVEDGQSAELAPFTSDWNVALQQGRFATITCPAWMLTQIEQQAKSTAGKWDVATVPGAAGNWGGSFLTVPRQGKHIDEAVALASWLTAPEQQAAVFKKTGILPSQPKLYKDPSITGQTKPFFNNAPVGRIFTDSALRLQPQPQGPATGEIQLIIGRGLTRVEQGRQSPDDSWRQVLTEVDRAARSD